MNKLFLVIIFLVILPILYFKFSDDAERGKDISKIKCYFLLIMHFLGWPLLYIFALLLPYVIIPILIIYYIFGTIKKCIKI